MDQYCSRYIVGTRGKGDVNTAANHLGFRCVMTPEQWLKKNNQDNHTVSRTEKMTDARQVVVCERRLPAD